MIVEPLQPDDKCPECGYYYDEHTPDDLAQCAELIEQASERR